MFNKVVIAYATVEWLVIQIGNIGSSKESLSVTSVQPLCKYAVIRVCDTAGNETHEHAGEFQFRITALVSV